MAKRRYEAALDGARERFLASGEAGPLLEAASRIAEELTCAAWQEHMGAAPRAVCLVAVGGFGRSERFPYSDVDLLVVAREPEAHAPALAAFLARLWDEGLRPSHSVRPPAECAQLEPRNFELLVSLLDRRFLAGDRTLYEELNQRLGRTLPGSCLELARLLCRAARQRHARYQDSVQHLEPDVKEAPGGLRDWQTLRWLSRLESAPAAPREELSEARRLLETLRCFLHLRSGRDDNRLSFEAQEELAGQPFSAGRSEADWMRLYFRAAREVHRAALQALERWEAAGSPLWVQFRDWRSRAATSEFTSSRGRVSLRAPALGEGDWGRVLRLFEFVGRHDLPLTADTERRLTGWVQRFGGGSRNLALWPALESILATPHASRALRAMHETGLLGAIFPEWREVDCLVVRDFHHRFTVDEHTLVSLEKLEALAGERTGPRRRFTDLLAEAGSLVALRCALLFHDVGKARPQCDHITESARMAEAALARVAAPEPLRRRVVGLIGRHADLADFMRRRDPDDPAAARRLASRLGTIEELRELALLTYADVSAVHPLAMTPWRLELLWRAYRAVAEELKRELDAERLPHLGSYSPEAAAFLEGLPTRYLRTRDEAAVQADLRLAQTAAARGVALEVERRDGYYVMRLAARDRPFLLASVAGALAAAGMSILRLEAFSNRQGIALDTIVFEDPERTLEFNPAELDRLQRAVARAAAGRLEPGLIMAARPKWSPANRGRRIQPAVRIDNEASPASTLIEVTAADRPGLLYDLALAISRAGCNVEVALVDTQARTALDLFYVTQAGAKLDPARAAALREALLAACAPPADTGLPGISHGEFIS